MESFWNMPLFEQFDPQIGSIVHEAMTKWTDLPPAGSLFALLAQSPLHDPLAVVEKLVRDGKDAHRAEQERQPKMKPKS